MKKPTPIPSNCINFSKQSEEYKKLVDHLKTQQVARRAHDLPHDDFQEIYHDHKECTSFATKNLNENHRKVKALVHQKIIIIPKDDVSGLQSNDTFKIEFDDNKEATGRIIRLSEFPNHDSEYGPDTYTALIAWKDSCDFGTLKKVNGKEITVTAQLDNISINEGGGAGNRPPSDPILEGDSSSVTTFPVQNDYRKINSNYHVGAVQPGTPTVAVLDTGSLFLESPYMSSQDDKLRHLPLLKREKSTYPFGFCSITKYLDSNYRTSMSGPKGNTHKMAKADILANPFDDAENRHGTTVSAIIANATLNNTNTASGYSSTATILPVKCFDYLGASTLFDILCAFNYVFSRIASDNIRVVNASWGLYIPEEKVTQLEILKKKIIALQKENVFVITSAGNRPQFTSEPHDLAKGTMYPACFSNNELTNLITVTTVATTIDNSSPDENDSFQAIENFSSKFVDIGVVGHSFEGIFSSPFKSKSLDDTTPYVVSGSSFAAAYIAGYLSELLIDKPQVKTKQEFFDLLPEVIRTSDSLNKVTKSGRYLLLPQIEYTTSSAYVKKYSSTTS